MANLKSYVYPGLGEFLREQNHYCQAIRVDNRILCSGQGGWDAKTDNYDFSNFIMDNLDDEIDQAFKNCDYNLKNAGGKGWSQVYKIVTYSTDIYSQHERIVHNLKKWMPEHTPIWTELGVNHLGLKEMNIEIDVEAYDEEGAAEARKAKA